MHKSPVRGGTSAKNSKTCSDAILAPKSPAQQEIQLKNLYKQRRLTDCLTILEGWGLTGEAAIFALQGLGGAL